MIRILLILLFLHTSPLWAHASEGKMSLHVGPDKGVLEVDEEQGFVLRSSAERNFSIQKTRLRGGPLWVIPSSCLVYSGLETQVMRQRSGHWKSVDVEVIRKSGSQAEVRSKDLLPGDLLAAAGLGFLKIIEQSVMTPHTDAHDD
jgi:hypothetical protein